MEYRYGRHTEFTIEYPFAWMTKYCDKALVGEVAETVRDLVRQTCEAFEIRILQEALKKWIPFMPFDKLRRAFDNLTTNGINILPFL